MKRFLLFSLACGALLIPVSVQAKCVNETVAQRLARAEVVVTGSPYSILEGDETFPTEVVFEPLTVYKGSVEDVISVVQPLAPTSIDVDLSSDEPYLLFLKKGTEEGTFTTDTCAGTRTLGTGLTADEQSALGAGTVVATPDASGAGADEPTSNETDGTGSNDVSADDVDSGDPELLVTSWVDELTGGSTAWWFWPVFSALMLWSLLWKGLALWRAAHRQSRVWFWVLLVVNTVGLLEIGYLIGTRTRAPTAAVPSASP